jgi:outer membrane protein OmpA-like peptidoglycan-associated protein
MMMALVLLRAGAASGAEVPAPTAPRVPWVVRHELNRDEATLRRDSARLSADLQVVRGADFIVLRIPVRLLFDPDSDHLRSGLRAAQMLALPTLLLRHRRRLMTRIEVYTDNIGGQQMNQDLSARRAAVLTGVLASAGIPARRVQAYGRGATEALASSDTAEGRTRNRRVEFTFARLGSAAALAPATPPAPAAVRPGPATGPAGG